MTATKPQINSVVKYYHAPESRWGYGLVLKNVKHFGYYPEGSEGITIPEAQANMCREIGKRLSLSEGSLILDGGCGEVPPSLVLAKEFGLRVEGVDIVDRHIEAARKRAHLENLDDKMHFQVADYADLNFPDSHFDGIFLMETLVHAPDYKKVLSELFRVLKPGGKLVLVEYSKSPKHELTPHQNWVFDQLIEYVAMPSFASFLNGSFPNLLHEARFTDVKVEDVSKRIVPMTRKLYLLSWVPYLFVRLLHQQKHFINSLWGVYHDPFNRLGIWRFNIVTAQKPLN